MVRYSRVRVRVRLIYGQELGEMQSILEYGWVE